MKKLGLFLLLVVAGQMAQAFETREFTPEELLIDGKPIVIGYTNQGGDKLRYLVDRVCVILHGNGSYGSRASAYTRSGRIRPEAMEAVIPERRTAADTEISGFARYYFQTEAYPPALDLNVAVPAILTKLTCFKWF